MFHSQCIERDPQIAQCREELKGIKREQEVGGSLSDSTYIYTYIYNYINAFDVIKSNFNWNGESNVSQSPENSGFHRRILYNLQITIY